MKLWTNKTMIKILIIAILITIVVTAIITSVLMIKFAKPDTAITINWFGIGFKYL